MHQGISTKESGQMIWLMDMGYIWTHMGQNIKENGSMIVNMVKGKRVGIMDRQNISDSFIRGRKMEKEDLSGKMEAFMTEIL